ncbi:metal-dependent transcriptional regulator [bacterium]|nr:metal-dependent transcriptional regulator [bacterium]MBU1066142.1 metal-dependent transcriptional regulator [bacterium]MBU1634294.1 metal-dependent transcriptional regulator [bacterium]MBU1875254.1 metal-dependent transcriptional regulator [bacterium]
MTQTILSESQQDYLKIVLDLINEKKVARIKEIARRKGVSMPSVTEAMRKLSKEDFVQYSVREFVELTPAGETAAHRLSSKNMFLKNFFIDVLGIENSIAEKEACELEHHLSVATLDRLILLYQFLSECKKNDQLTLHLLKNCVRSAEGMSEIDPECKSCFVTSNFPHQMGKSTVHTLLAKLNRGQKGQVVMLGPDTELRRRIIEKGLLPGSAFVLEEKGDAESPYRILSDGCSVELDIKAANMIEVAIEQSN